MHMQNFVVWLFFRRDAPPDSAAAGRQLPGQEGVGRPLGCRDLQEAGPAVLPDLVGVPPAAAGPPLPGFLHLLAFHKDPGHRCVW